MNRIHPPEQSSDDLLYDLVEFLSLEEAYITSSLAKKTNKFIYNISHITNNSDPFNNIPNWRSFKKLVTISFENITKGPSTIPSSVRCITIHNATIGYNINAMKLTELNLSNCATVTGISSLINLNTLSIEKVDVFGDLSCLIQLTKLKLKNQPSIKGISSLTSLTDLKISGESSISEIDDLVNLKTLYLNTATITDISRLTNLTHLSLMRRSNVTDISTLKSLKVLNLRKNRSVKHIPDVSIIYIDYDMPAGQIYDMFKPEVPDWSKIKL